MPNENDLNNLNSMDEAAMRAAAPELFGGAAATTTTAAAATTTTTEEGGAATTTTTTGTEAAAGEGEGAKPEGEGAAAAVADAAAAGEAKPGEGAAKAPAPVMIPKERFDEAVGKIKDESRDKDTTIAAQAQRIKELEAKASPPAPARDFDAEHTALVAKFDEGDLTLAELLVEQRKLSKEETNATAAAIADTRIAERDRIAAVQTAEDAFKSADQAWTAANAEFLKADGAAAAMQTALDVVDKQHEYKLPPAQLFEKAGRVAAAMIGANTPAAAGGAPAGGATTAQRDPHAERNARDAAAQALASSTPAPLSGGQGDRGTGGAAVDLSTMKQGDFGKLSKSDQNRLLGLV